MRYFDYVIAFLTMIAAITLGAGYLGAVHPFFDSLAVARLYILISLGLAIVYFGLRKRVKWALATLLVFGISLGSMVPHLVNRQDPGDIRFMQANILFRNDGTQHVAYLNQTQFDIVTLQEVTPTARRNLLTLNSYPTKHHCDFATVGGVMILSRYPVLEQATGCSQNRGIAWVRVMTPDGPLTIVSLHLHWPWPFGQANQIKRLLPIIESLPKPVVIGGDFNMVPWGHAVQQIEEAANSRTVGGLRMTLTILRGFVHLPIDHILIPDGSGTAQKGPKLGSDHYSVLGDINLRQ